jgi:hypothetical protein
MPLSKFIHAINDRLSGMISGIKLYGVAQSMERNSGTVVETLPAVIDKSGEAVYVGLDDVHPAILYHKNTAINFSRGTGNSAGYGDQNGYVIAAYTMAMYLYLDHKRTNLLPDEAVLYIRANFADLLKMEPYQRITPNITSVILNSAAVLRTEYVGSDFLIPPGRSLTQINYTIESVYKNDCFEKCPEVLTC